MNKKRLKIVAESILESVTTQSEKAIQHFDSSPLPDKEILYELIQDIFVVLFPGYFGRAGMSFDSIEMRISYRVARIYETLKPQVYREMIHGCRKDPKNCCICEEAAEELVLNFLETVPEIRDWLDKDVEAAFKNDPAAGNFDEIIFSYPGLEAIAVHRIAHFFYQNGLRIIPRILSEWAHSKTGVDIHPGAVIGQSFFIDHGTGVVIGETTVIGDNVTLYQGVTLGALNFPKDKEGKIIRNAKRHPTIGHSTVIYAGATILGGETVIGEHSVIGGNVWLTESVPPNSRVVIGDSGIKITNRRNSKLPESIRDQQ